MPEPVPSPQRPPQEAEAEHALRSRILARVIAGAVHDIRTPLGTIMMKLQLLRDAAGDGGLPGEQLPQHLRVLDAQVERVTEILRKLASAVEPPAPLGWVDLAALLPDVAGALSYEARFHGVELTVEPRTVGVRAGADPEAVGRLVLCVFGRALAGTPRGGKLSARAAVRNGAAVLEIERTSGDPGDGLGYDMDVLAAAAAALGGRLERTHEREIERMALALPQIAPATEGAR
ncbi:MAG TPA: histidine kinase dimerization/phospho-acceptor domain-containing protein [Anaeromyxobacter sp.]